jgi:hypothetical protein
MDRDDRQTSPHRLGRIIIDGAFLALVVGSAVGTCTLVAACQGHRLQRPRDDYDGAGWGCLETPPATAAVIALSERWPTETRRAYLSASAWWEQVADRVRHTGLFGSFELVIRGGRGQARVERMGAFEDQRLTRSG